MFKIQVPEVLDNKLDITFLLFYWWEVSQSHADHRPVHWTLSINAQNKNKGVYVLDTFFTFFRGRIPPYIPTLPRSQKGDGRARYHTRWICGRTFHPLPEVKLESSECFFILPYLNVVSWNIFLLGGPFWGLLVVKLS